MALLDKYKLAEYIKDKYRREYGKEIGQLKLNLAMYFLFGMYGGKIAQAQEGLVEDENWAKMDKYLFDANFVAQRYGPIEEDINEKYYKEEK